MAGGVKPATVGLPPRPFLYTLDQIANMIDVPMERLRTVYIYHRGITYGAPNKDQIFATNIAPNGSTPDWRVTEQELVRWFKRKGIRIHTRTWAS